jgi:hypothetical protein
LLFVLIVLLKNELANHLCVEKQLGALCVDFILLKAIRKKLLLLLKVFLRLADRIFEVRLPPLSISDEFGVIPVEQRLKLVHNASKVFYLLRLFHHQIFNMVLSVNDLLPGESRLFLQSDLHLFQILLRIEFNLFNSKPDLVLKFYR